MEENIQKFYDYLDGLLKSYVKLSDTLKAKIEAVNHGNLEKLSDVMKDEQAYVLISRGFDDHIKGYQGDLGIEGDSLGDIIPKLPAPWQLKFRGLYLELRNKLEEVRGLNELCQTTLESKLADIDKRLQGTDGAKYNDNKKIFKEPKTGLFDKSI